MRSLRPALLVCSALFLAASVSAQSSSTSTPSASSDPQAVALLQKSLAALTNGTQITDVTLTGSAQRTAGSDNETGSATLEATALGDSRVELSFASGNRTEIRNHAGVPSAIALPPGVNLPAGVVPGPQPVGEWIGPDGAPHAMASHNVMTDAAWFFPALTLQRLAALQTNIFSYVGQETHDGVTVLHISAIQPYTPPVGSSANNIPLLEAPPAQIIAHASEMDLYIDPNSFLPVALDFNQHPDNNALVNIPVEIRFSVYKTLSGVMAPMEVQKYFNGSLLLDLQFTSVTLNSGLPASAFALQ